MTRVVMSAEEMKIRSELEMGVERDLEAEIKDGIYHLALRLHRLYQNQKERHEKELSAPGHKNQQGLTNKKTLSEVTISIRMDGGTKVEIKEIKKEAREHGRPPTSSRSSNMRGMISTKEKKFDWAKSLRSEAHPLVIKKESSRISYQGRRKWTSGTGQHMGVENKLLEIGWKC